MMEDIRTAAMDQRPVFAECGGLMYLCRKIEILQDFSGLSKGTSFKMADASCKVHHSKKRIVIYVTGKTTRIFRLVQVNLLR